MSWLVEFRIYENAYALPPMNLGVRGSSTPSTNSHGINFAAIPDARPATPASPTITYSAPMACSRITHIAAAVTRVDQSDGGYA